MELCEKKYPYPVLLPKGDDYVGCRFEVEIKSHKTPTEIVYHLEASLDCPDLRAVVDRGDAAVILHVECPQSAFRKSFAIPLGAADLQPLSTNDLSGKIFLCPFIVAQRELHDYRSDSFNPEYDGFSFNIRCGSILAEGEQLIDYADTVTRDIDFKPDIFSVVPYTPQPEDGERMKVDLALNQKITIKLPQNIYAQYNAMMKSGEAKEFLWSAIILPAVMEALYKIKECLQNDESADFESKIWYMRLTERIEQLHPNAKSDLAEFFDKKDIPELAQELIKNPVSAAVSKLASFGGTREDEDEN
jgi:hypothetical protein